jgi:hypothetical protein
VSVAQLDRRLQLRFVNALRELEGIEALFDELSEPIRRPQKAAV